MAATQKLSKGFHQIANGLRFGVPFLRSSTFVMPDQISVRGKGRFALTLLPERGVKADFMACVIRNDYGLGTRLRKIDTIVDIGANIGLFSLAASGWYPNAKLHTYEPNPRVLPCLLANTSGLPNCTVFPEAAGTEEGTVEIIESGDSNLAMTSTATSGSIHLTAFSNVLDRIGGEIDLLKLDCEGAEWDLFQVTECWKHVRYLRMEYHLVHGHTFPELIATLTGLGLSVIHHRPDIDFGMVWAEKA